ncbi:Mitochondrial fission 1 protein A, partial [Dichanthelium oligosanthes]
LHTGDDVVLSGQRLSALSFVTRRLDDLVPQLANGFLSLLSPQGCLSSVSRSVPLAHRKPHIKLAPPSHGSNHPSKNREKGQGKRKEGSGMDGHVGKFMDSVGSIFRGGDVLPWCDRDIIAGFEREIAEAANEGQKNDSLMRLSWALVHSRQPEDVNRGIGMLQVPTFSRFLQIQPDWRQALTLQRLVEEKTRRDGMIGMALITGAFGLVGLVAGGIIAAASSSSSRKK